MYNYDKNNRLAAVNYPGQPMVDFTYDWVGNRINPGGFGYNAADQLTSANGHTYGYDGAGNLTIVDGSPTYTYTPANLLETAAGSSMIWDGAGNRVRFTSSTGAAYSFVYDPAAGMPAVIEEVTPSGTVYYIREPDGSLIARIAGGAVQYYHFDDLGSTSLLTNDGGRTTDDYSDDAWGNVSHSGTTSQPYQYVGELGYYTHHQDAKLDLLQLRVRFYDSETGRFTQRDPLDQWVYPGALAGSAYWYADDTPTVKRDPLGLYAEFWCTTGPACCPQLGKYVKETLDALGNEKCANAVREVGCTDFMDKMRDPNRNPLQGMTIYCKKLKGSTGGYCRTAHDITIDCRKGRPAETILHELVQACAFNAGEKPDQKGPWECPVCGTEWKNADPVWEGNAERVRHACFK